MKIFYLMGKSSTGKDTIYKSLINNEELGLKRIVPYTTRPIRFGEENGVDYIFMSNEEFEQLNDDGKIIEFRAYNTVNGLWIYFTPKMDLQDGNYMSIGSLESYESMKKVYGENLIPVYIELDDGIRLQRALTRELTQKTPNYAEMCRRFLADLEDFSENKLSKNEITVRFENNNLQDCTDSIINYIKEMIN